MVVGSGSDLSEEPAVQDAEPVTLDFVSFLSVLPGPVSSLLESAGVGDQWPVDDVGELALQRSDRFFGALALGDVAVVVVAAGAGVAELGDGDDVDRAVQLAVAARVQPMPRRSPEDASMGAVAL